MSDTSLGADLDRSVPTLSIDRGNTTLDLLFTTRDGTERIRLPVSGEGLAAKLAAWQPERVVALTVVEGGLDHVRAALAPVPVLEAGVDVSNPLQHSYADPARLGVDRWVGAVAAWREYGDACVVDCGTAVTIDAVSADGVFLGGVIGPGAGTMAGGLAQHAPALPTANLKAVPVLPANCSQDAVDAGTILGFVGLVEGLTARLLGAVDLAHATCLCTGGNAGFLVEHSSVAWVSVPELNHRGLRWLLSDHVSKS